MPPGIRPLSRIAILAAALTLAAPLTVQARGGGGGGGHGGVGGFHGGFAFGAMRGAGIPTVHGGFIGAPGRHFSGVLHPGLRGEHSGLAFRLGNRVALHSGRNSFFRSGPGIPPLRGTAVPPLAGNPVPPLTGSFRGPEIWRRGQGGVWHHHLGSDHSPWLSAGVLGFGLLAPVASWPLAETPYGLDAYGDSCNAQPYVCPIAPEAPVGTPCACPLAGGGVAQGWVE
jgi:hypothetical protein